MTMRSLPFLLIACLTLVLMVGEADAELDARDKEWDSDVSRITQVDISADGEYIAASSRDAEVFLFNKDDEEPIWEYDTGGDMNVAISSNGKYIAAGSANKVYLFSKNSNTPLWNYSTGSNSIVSVDISADGKYIAAGSSGPENNNVYLFDRDSSTPLWSYPTGESVSSVVISGNGKYIAAGSAKEIGRIYLFDKDSSTPLWIYDEELNVSALHISISADGENMVAGMQGDSDCSFYVFNRNSNISLWSYTSGNQHDQGSSSCPVAISADGDYIVAGSGKKFYLFDKDRSKPLWNYDTGGSYAVSVAISGDGDYIVAGSGGHIDDGALGKLYFFEMNDNQPLWYHDGECCGSFGANYDSYGSVAISANGDYIVASEGDVEFFTKKDSVLGFLSEFFDTVAYHSIITLAILAGLFQFRKDTGIDDNINKLLRIPLYGMAFLVFLIALFLFWIGSATDSPIIEKVFIVAYFLLFATLFAVTGIFLGHETHDPTPSSSYKSSIPSSKPIFADRRASRVTPVFTPENELITIECPGCSAEMEVPKLGAMQNVTCSECGLSGEIEI